MRFDPAIKALTPARNFFKGRDLIRSVEEWDARLSNRSSRRFEYRVATFKELVINAKNAARVPVRFPFAFNRFYPRQQSSGRFVKTLIDSFWAEQICDTEKSWGVRLI